MGLAFDANGAIVVDPRRPPFGAVGETDPGFLAFMASR
jgi:hypothetical protein